MEAVLYVPISLQCLVQGIHNGPSADLTPAYDLLNGFEPPLGDSVVNTWFTTTERKAGIHLHWVMPDGLLHGQQCKDGNIDFPPLPNRFILQRLWEKDGKICRKAWLLLSDFVTSELYENWDNKTVIPTFVCRDGNWEGAGPDKEMYGYQGDVLEYGESLSKDGYFLDKLTPVGDGSPWFAAYYPDCQSVFGFYDDMADVSEGICSYLLTGYYDDPNQDPLCHASSDTLKDLGWQFKEGGPIPTHSLFHGYIKQVEWKGADYAYEDRIPKEDVQVYVGDTTAEALSALIQDKVPDIPGMERLMNYLQNNAIQVLDNEGDPDALITAEELLHSTKFTLSEGGCSWQIRNKKTQEEKQQSETVTDMLEKLNQLQNRIDKASEEALSRRERLFREWWMYVTNYWDSIAGDGIPETARKELEQLENLEQDIADGQQEAETIRKQIDGLLKESGDYLFANSNNRYYQPNPPVVLLADKGIKRQRRQGVMIQEGTLLPCRSTVLDTLTVKLNDTSVDIGAKELAECVQPLVKELPDMVSPLLSECILLDESFAECVAEAALKKAAKTYIPEDKKALANQVREEQDKLAKTDKAPDVVAFQGWEQPWNPLLLEWRASIEPFRTSAESDDSYAGFSLGELDLEPDQEELPSQKAMELRGCSMLLPHGVVHLHDMLMQLIEMYGKEGEIYEKLKKAAETVKDMDVLSQQLTGFLDALRQKKNVPILPLMPLEDVPETTDFVKRANAALAGSGTAISSPEPGYGKESFLPVRAGKLRLDELWLVDSFGQIQKISLRQEKVRSSETLKQEKDGSIILPPRFLSQVRTVFEWNKDTPIFGYLMPNYLDHCLFVYDKKGNLLGSIQRLKKGAQWNSAPGTNLKPEDIQEGGGHLQAFVKSFLGEDNPRLGSLLQELDMSSASTLRSSRFLQLCFGDVLALGSAAAGLEEKGLSIQSDIWGVTPDTYGYETESVVMRLGDGRRLSNGLAGFYLRQDDITSTYEEFHSCLSGNGDLKVSLKGGLSQLTLLFWPFGDISIRTGFLPAQTVKTLSCVREEQMENLDMMFRLMPVFGSSEDFNIPLPGNLEDLWEFHYFEDFGKEKVIEKLRMPSDLVPSAAPQALEGWMKTKQGNRKQ